MGERDSGIGYQMASAVDAGQNQDRTILEELFEEYCSPRGISYNATFSDREDRPNHSSFVRCYVSNAEGIKQFLEPIIPLLREKRRQSVIMVEEILPRYKDGQHRNKRGFLELMRWKEELDKNKPMSNADRKYTYDYFAHELGWLEDVEQQQRLESWE